MERFSSIKKSLFYLQLLIFSVIILAIVAGCNHSKPLGLKPGENVRARLHLEASGPFHVGDTIPLVLTVEARKGISYDFPQFDDKTAGGLELKMKQPSSPETFPEGTRQSIRYLLTGWYVGQFTIPATNLAYQTSSHQQSTIKLHSIRIKVTSVLPKGTSPEELLTFNIKGLQAPLSLEPRYFLLKWFVLGALILILFGVLYHIYCRSQTGESAAESYKEPAHIIAFRRLANLKTLEISDPAGFKIFYFELSECIREYIENRYSIRALEMTTEEFLIHLTTGGFLNPQQQSLLKDFMQQADLVKFANLSPSMEEAEKELQQIEQLVETTKELPVESDTTEMPVQTTL